MAEMQREFEYNMNHSNGFTILIKKSLVLLLVFRKENQKK